jgi:hypothetical protein
MAEAAKVIRIELRVGGSNGGSSSSVPKKKKESKEKKIPKSKTMLGRMELTTNKLAGAGAITFANQLTSEAFSIAETLSYNSEEKTNMMFLDMQKKAISGALITGGYVLGGPVGAAVGLAVKQLIVDPVSKGGEIAIRRNLDYTRATNRFYLTDFAGKGNYTFNYTTGSYVNEDLDKVRKSSFYKKGGAL